MTKKLNTEQKKNIREATCVLLGRIQAVDDIMADITGTIVLTPDEEKVWNKIYSDTKKLEKMMVKRIKKLSK